jgi:hypothetical protein
MSSESVDVFSFMTLRAGQGDVPGARLDLVPDDEYVHRDPMPPMSSHHLPNSEDRPSGLHDADLFSMASVSPIGRLVYGTLFGNGAASNEAHGSALRELIIGAVESQLVAGLEYGIGGNTFRVRPVLRTVDFAAGATTAGARAFASIGGRAHYLKGQRLYVLPAGVADFQVPMEGLEQAIVMMRTLLSRGSGRDQDVAELADGIARIAGADPGPLALAEWVFGPNGEYSPAFAFTKRILFDHLYALFILRKRERVPLDPVTTALTGLHAVELLALGQYFREAIRNAALPAGRSRVIDVLATRYPDLVRWDPSAADAEARLAAAELPHISRVADLARCLEAKPVVHPVFARLTSALKTFNPLVPVGIGDLKVVKQTFLGYRKGEIAHIETVLAGETKKRQHRSLERNEDSFTAMSSNDSETARDSQSTARFELKNEAEQTLKTDIGVNAGASFTYKGSPVVDASVTAGMTFASSRSIGEKTSRSFVNEVMAKATSRVQSRVSQSRSQSRLTESEETVSHEFTNEPDNGNISGVYRWLDKVYEGQVHNYGKRLMFEFVLPEPAAFYVESRLYAYLASLDLPVHPGGDTPAGVPKMPVTAASEIDEAKFLELGRTYDLSGHAYPREVLDSPPFALRSTEAGDLSFKSKDPYVVGRLGIKTLTYDAWIPDLPAGYYVDQVHVSGSAEFAAANENSSHTDVQNTLVISFGQHVVFSKIDETNVLWSSFARGDATVNYPPLAPGQVVPSSPLSISITDTTCIKHDLRISVTLRRSAETYRLWQEAVYAAVYRQFQAASAGAATDPAAAAIAEYERALDEVAAKPLNEIIRGGSSAANDGTVRRELKRQCIAMVTREFDDDASDDLISGMDATGPRLIDVFYPSLEVGTPEATGNDRERRRAIARFIDRSDTPLPSFTAINLAMAKRKGTYVQFLEQAFEWEQLSSLFYPYFWARLPRWVELMNREDSADPMFTEFLQAGSVRVLLAVKPGYENAVLHFLATREPWEGGPSPVIGDPLFIPLYQEVHNRQDNLAGSLPEGEPWEFSLPTSLVYLETGKPLPMEYVPDPAP